MKAGVVIGGRFELGREAGSGGMSTVWRAIDLTTGSPVAIKLLRSDPGLEIERFEREAELLASLAHPGIVRYVAHGASGAGPVFLALEWLDGEDLLTRLGRAALSVGESLTLVGRVAEALGAAHASGIVHRDVKPSNVFLVDRDVTKPKLLDFGVARLRGPVRPSTRTGVALGTPGYMAPEQARGDPEVDARADVFSLGCVLFECLTGQPAFDGEQPLSILAKILFDDAPRLRDIVPEMPGALERVVGRMLAKDRERRPADALVVAAELSALGAGVGAVGPSLPPPPGLTTLEQRRMSLLMLAGVGADADLCARLREAAVASGARLDVLVDGSAAVRLPGTGPATDQAARAAALALAQRALAPDAPMALATGRAEQGSGATVGEVIERAAALLALPSPGLVGDVSEDAPEPAQIRPVRVDDVTAGLLDGRFEVAGDAEGLFVCSFREAEAGRTLLGRVTPLVGREAELGMLEELYHHCASEEVAGAVLVLGPPGAGKSRLRHEFVRAIRAEAEDVEIWLARGDPISSGSAFALVASLLQRIAGLAGNETLAVRQQKLRARLGRHLGGDDLVRVAEFLGEITGAPFPDEGSVQLRAARRDAQLMGDQIRRAWEDFVSAECGARPVVVVLEDVHWGDLPSISLVDAALRHSAEKRLMLLALGRPEVTDIFPGIWAERALQRIQLGGLARKASERLVREVLGDSADAESVSRIVETAAGNAFYLEELIRAVAEGKGADLPETVLAMVEARLEALEPDARRLLRAASVFGQVFWAGGVRALLGAGAPLRLDPPTARTSALVAWLDELVRREVIAVRSESRFAGEREHAFRHALIREAAHATLTDADRELGHRLAADWLEQRGETDAMVLAEHFERGAEPARAVTWFSRAAEQALEGNDLAAALARAGRAIASGAQGEVLGALELLRAEAHRWRGENDDATRSAEQAMQLLPRGSARWCATIPELAIAITRSGARERLAAIGGELLAEIRAAAARDPGGPSPPVLIAAARAAVVLHQAGEHGAGDALLEACAAFASAEGADPAAVAHLQRARGWKALAAGDPSASAPLLSGAALAFDRVGDARSACAQRGNMGFAYNELGAFADAEHAIRAAHAGASRLGLAAVAAATKHNLGWALARLGRLDEARALELEAALAFHAQGDRRMESGSRTYLARIHLLAGEPERAEVEAAAAADLLPGAATAARACALATLAHALLAQGRTAEALEHARAAVAPALAAGHLEEGEALVRLAHAEALHAAGEEEAARVAIADAEARLRGRAAAIGDTEWRSRFLQAIPEHARTIALAAAWKTP